MRRLGWVLLAAVAVLVCGGLRGREVEAAPTRANGLVVLLTDYGSDDAYPGILKGVILAANQQVRILDATHDVPNFDVAAASYMLGRMAVEWPAGTTFVVIVDPGVGTPRKKLAVRTVPDGRIYIGPDNGVFTDILAKAEAYEVRELANPRLRRPGTVSDTFHGRDWFGPVAGHLAGGVPFEEVGPAVAEIAKLPRVRPHREGGDLVGSVVYVDHYGNVLTNLTHADLNAAFPAGGRLQIQVDGGNPATAPWVRTYSDVARGELLVTTHNAEGTAEVAINYGNAGEQLQARPGATIRLRAARE